MNDFAHKLIQWYHQNKRDLPWRNTKDPYKIWLSEIILQQTRVQQGMSYYLAFTKNYPTVKDLAEAPQDDVLKLWEGLGYYSRARNLHFTAQFIQNELNGQFPSIYKEIIQLKGVGPYTGAAIASFAFNEKQAAVDGNVYRVLSRLHDIDTPIDSTEGKKLFQSLADELISEEHPGDFNQAMMELGATVCTPKQASCNECPFEKECLSRQKNTLYERPIKSKKIKSRDRFFHYIILKNGNDFFIQQRGENDIWQGLYEFHLIEAESSLPEKAILTHDNLLKFSNNGNFIAKTSFKNYKQTLSHQKVHSTFILLELEEDVIDSNNLIRVSKNDLINYAFPRTITLFLEDYYIDL